MEVMGVTSAFWNGKKVFLTGHTGFKGSWLCKILVTLGAEVTGYALPPPTNPNLYSLCKPDVTSIIDDIRNFDRLYEDFKKCSPEIVIHMAAQPLVLESYRFPRYTYDVNVMGTVNVLECVRLHGRVKSLINVTTDKVYLNSERTEGYTEVEQLNGYDPYANSKSCSELVTSSYDKSFFRQEGVPVSTVRSGNVIGGGDFSKNRIIPDCARFLSNGKTIQIRNPNSVRPYQHVLETLFVYLMIAQSQHINPGVSGAFNISPDESDCITNAQITDMFCHSWGNGASWEHIKTDTSHEDNLLKLNCNKIKETFGWEANWNIKKSVIETVEWYKAFYNSDNFTEIMEKQIDEYIKHYITEKKGG